MVKIFHTGDNHLDSSFFRLSPLKREEERERQRQLFKKMIRYAKDKNYDLIFICGDLFDSPEISPETENAVIESLGSFEGPVIISPGNHDPYNFVSLYSSGKLPENVYIFNSPELQAFDFEELGLQVCGYAFMNDTYTAPPLKNVTLPSFNGTRLLCAHGELGVSISKYAPIQPSELEALGFSYAALGHIHKGTEIGGEGNIRAAYCGFPEGRAFDEQGDGGAISVTLNGTDAKLEKLIFSEKRYLLDTVDVSGANSDNSLAQTLEKYLSDNGYGKETALRLTLSGTTDADFCADLSLTEKLLSPRLAQLELIDLTVPDFDARALENDHTLRGEVYRTLKPLLESDSPEKRKTAYEALKVALLAIEGRRII